MDINLIIVGRLESMMFLPILASFESKNCYYGVIVVMNSQLKLFELLGEMGVQRGIQNIFKNLERAIIFILHNQIIFHVFSQGTNNCTYLIKYTRIKYVPTIFSQKNH